MQRRDVERVWPERLKIRDTGLHDDLGGPGQRIYTTAGRGYERVEYVRADLYDALLAERDAALAAAPQPAPAPAADEREAMIRAMHMTADSCPLDRSLFDTIADALLADALLAAGYRKADACADAPETLAWAVVGEDGSLIGINYDRETAQHLCNPGESVVRVAIRVVEAGA